MALHITDYRQGFTQGLTWLTLVDDDEDNTGIALGVLKLVAGDRYEIRAERETAWLLMSGSVKATFGHTSCDLERHSLFDESPASVHVAAGTSVIFDCSSDAEFTVYQTANQQVFDPKIYLPEDVDCENRGKGQVGGTCWRVVRTIFGLDDSRPHAELVLGEVITLPGCWSSYPPHHHPQPEIYHYRFTEAHGYGHAELGDQVFKVQQYDSIKILDLKDHAQCAAPGYGMYYSWVIRHLPGNRYHMPEFAEEHAWVMQPEAECWKLKQ